MSKPEFRVEFDPAHGKIVEVSDNIQRITATNSGPFTFHGTNTYILGKKNLAVIDPGPIDDDHLQLIIEAAKGRTISHIIITHTHADHSPLAKKLKELTGAPTYAEGPHRSARDLHIGELNPLDASADKDFAPDHVLKDGDRIVGDDWELETIHTPGHTANHSAFALAGTDLMFSGDHVMAWATSIVAPPDGSMTDYMNSLNVMSERSESTYLPGHGGRVIDAQKFVRALRAHRKMRETAVLSRIRAGDVTIPEIVKVIYQSTDPKLHGAAGLSVLAHIEDLVERGLIKSETPPAIHGKYYAV